MKLFLSIALTRSITFTENTGTQETRALALLKEIPKSKVGLSETVGKISTHFEPVYGC